MDDKTVEDLKEMKAFEDKTANRLMPFWDSLRNPLVKLFIHSLILDTMRHSDIYQTLIDLNEEVILGDVDRKIMTEELANHFKEEKKMLKKAKEIAKNVKDEYFKK